MTELENRFIYHPPKDGQKNKYELLRQHSFSLVNIFNEFCPDSREKSLAITKIEEALFWANASIARNEIDHKLEKKI